MVTRNQKLAMDQLMSSDRVKNVIRRNVNLDYLAPMLIKHGPLLTPLEFQHLCDRTVGESSRIEYLIERLAKKGEQVGNFTKSLKEEKQHTGHKDILLFVEEEAQNLSASRKRELDSCCEADSNKRAKTGHLNGTNGIIKAIPDFAIRKSMLHDLLKQLVEDNDKNIYCVCGMPAVGKSQLAIAAGLEMQQKFGYALTYLNFVGKTKFDDHSVDAIGLDNQCLILDNIDGLLCNPHQQSILIKLLQQALARFKNMKVITTSCKMYRDAQVTVKEVRVLPFSNAESISYLLKSCELHPSLSQFSDKDFEPVLTACAGVPLALKCAFENLQDGAVDIDDFHESSEILDLLEVPSYCPANLVLDTFKNSFSLLHENLQKVLKEVANDVIRLQDVNSRTMRSLYNSGWLEHFNEQTETYILNSLQHLFLKGDFPVA